MKLFFAFYGFLWAIVMPFLTFHKRIKDGYLERKCLENWAKLSDEEPIDLWIQASSGGEAYLSLYLLNCLDKNCRVKHILCTSMTRQGIDLLEKGKHAFYHAWQEKYQEPAPRLTILFFPFDTAKIMEKAFVFARPKACILLETELWLNFMLQCKKRAIPLYILNARITEKTFSSYKKIQGLLQNIAPTKIFATRTKDAKLYQALFPSSIVKTMNNIKFSIVYNELQNELHNKENKVEIQELASLFPSSSPLFLLASTRKEEEGILLPLIQQFYEQKTKSILIIAPRHVARFYALQALLQQVNIPVLMASDILKSSKKKTEETQETQEQCPIKQAMHAMQNGYKQLEQNAKAPQENIQTTFPEHAIVIWDIFGDLKKLYALADHIFVGGSLAPLGGQNFLEPLVYGKIAHTGIFLNNFLWCFEAPHSPQNSVQSQTKSLVEENLLRLHSTSKAFIQSFLSLSEEKQTDTHKNQNRFNSWLKPYIGDTKNIMQEICESITKK